MIRHWDEFYGGPTQPSDERVHVSLNSRGVILLNPKAFEKMGEPKAAVLLYDRRNSTIGVRPASVDTQHAFPLFAKSNFRHRLIRARPFCRHHKIKVERTMAFPTPEIDNEGTMLLELHTAIEVGRGD